MCHATDFQVEERLTDRTDAALLIQRAVDNGNIEQLLHLMADVGLIDADTDADVALLGPLYMRMLRTLVQAKMRRPELQHRLLSIDDVQQVRPLHQLISGPSLFRLF